MRRSPHVRLNGAPQLPPHATATAVAPHPRAASRCRRPSFVSVPFRLARRTSEHALAGKRKSRHPFARVETGKKLVRDTPPRRSIEISLAFRPQCRTGLRCGPSAAGFASVSDRNLEPVRQTRLRYDLRLATGVDRSASRRRRSGLANLLNSLVAVLTSCAEGAPSPNSLTRNDVRPIVNLFTIRALKRL